MVANISHLQKYIPRSISRLPSTEAWSTHLWGVVNPSEMAERPFTAASRTQPSSSLLNASTANSRSEACSDDVALSDKVMGTRGTCLCKKWVASGGGGRRGGEPRRASLELRTGKERADRPVVLSSSVVSSIRRASHPRRTTCVAAVPPPFLAHPARGLPNRGRTANGDGRIRLRPARQAVSR